MIKRFLLCVFFNLAALALLAQGIWSTKASMSVPRTYTGGAVINGKFYVVGGAASGGSTNSLEVYDPGSNSWSSLAPMPTSRAYPGVAVISNKLYVVGGCIGSDCIPGITGTLEVYDPVANSWETKTAMPTARTTMAVGAIGDKLYVAGGMQQCGPCTPLSLHQVYDVTSNSWSSATPLPAPVTLTTGAVINGKFYVVGGQNGTPVNSLYEYDPVSNTWATKANLPTARYGVGVGVINNQLYAVSGAGASGASSALEIYNPSSNSWSTGPAIPTPRVNPAAAAISNVLFVAGSVNATNSTILETFTVGTQPAIISFSPSNGPIGTTVTITGSNFDPTSANNIVFFGATRATVTAATATQLTVSVPIGATYQPITVTVGGLTAYSTAPFIITFPGGGVIDVNTFLPKVDFTTGNSPQVVAIGDVDGDGKPDLVVTNRLSNTVSVFRNTSTSGSITAGSFTSKVDFTTGANPYIVAIGDVDGDGKPDLVVPNAASNTVSVFRNTSTSGSITVSSFASKVDFTTGANPYIVAIGDVDGDGKPDLVVAGGGGTLSVFRNTSASGSITASSFDPKVDFTTGSDPRAAAIGDVDGDGKPDLVVANYSSNTVSVFRNTSASGSITASSFAPKVDFTTGIGPDGAAIGDVDGDGKPDLVVTNDGSSTVSVFRNTSASGSITASSFASRVDFTTGTVPNGVAIGDVDGDGKPDLVVTNNGGSTVSVFRNTSAPGSITASSFASKVDFTTGSGPYRAAIGDVDGDGKPDLVVADGSNNTVSVLRNTITTTPAPTISSFNPISGPVGTGVTITGTNFSTTPTNNTVYFGATKAIVTTATATQLTVTVPTGATYQPITVTVGGLTAYSNAPFNVTFPGLGVIDATSLAAKVDFTTGTNPQSVAVGDLDGDGKPDLAIPNYSSNTVSVFRNTSVSGSITSSSFAAKVDFTTGTNPEPVAIGDLDGDGKPDLVVANYGSNTVSVFRNTSISGSITSSSVAAKVDFTTGTLPRGVTIGDIDGDGKPEVVVTNQTGNTVSVFRNTGTQGSITTGSFAAKVDFTTGSDPVGVTMRDVDGDVKPDIVVGNYTSNTISVYRNTSVSGAITTGSFAAKVDFTTGTNPLGIATGDLDGDGKPDIVVANNNSATVSVHRNTSIVGSITPSSLAAKVDFTTGSNPWNVSIGDINGDGKPELAVANSVSNTVSVLKNTSVSGAITSGSFATKVDFTTGAQPYYVAVGDMDGDGKPDLAVANNSANTVSIFRNSISTVPAPTITSFNPTTGAVGTSVTITGTNFSTTPSNNIVKFNGTIATIIGTPTATGITSSVPTGATTGRITVEIGGQTATSATDFTVTSTSTTVQIASESFVTTYDKGATLTVSITVNDATKVSVVNFKSRGISEAASALKSVAVTAVGNKFEKVVAAADLMDPIGLIYSFEVIDLTLGVVNSTTGKAYVKYPASSADQVLPGLSFGNQVSNYQIIAVPLELSNKSVSSVFASLMPYDKTKWRLFDYANNDNREFSAFNTIDAGKGYWLIVRTSTTINPGEGKSVQADDAAPFTINFSTGWNLIGNPYNFRVSWTDVLTANSNPAGVDANLKVFSGGALTNGTILDKYRGAFVFSNNAVSMKIPVTRNTSLGGRVKEEIGTLNSLDQNQWEVKLILKEGPLSNELGGIGMHPKATLYGKDPFDEVSVPLPEGLNLFELAYPHPEVFTYFNKEVVPTQENYRWDFEVKRSSPAGNLELFWANDYFGDNEKQLVLFDPTTLQIMDMRKVDHITLTTATSKLSVLYGGPEYIQHALDSVLPWLGYPYPNPAKEELTIPFRVPESHDQMLVKISILNGTGVEVATPVNRTLGKGNYDVKWYPQWESGLYLIRMRIGQDETKTMKVIIK